jgi:CelD/BcsL family acetyltransferase involved in cellulose biosynthesis
LSAAVSYVQQGSTLRVVNRLLDLPADAVDECVTRMFDACPAARRIVIEAMYTSGAADGDNRFPCRVWRAAEDFELTLPRSFDEYCTVFGAKTRKNLRYCERRFEREHPAAEVVVLEGDAIDASTVDAIVRLNHLRMESKGRESGLDSDYARKLLALLRSCGVACVAREGGEVLGGTLCTRVGSGWSLQVIAHDPRFNQVRLGLLCLLRTIEAAIASGAGKFHFLWGEAEYKALFGARMRPLWTHCYYRSSIGRVLAVVDWAAKGESLLRRRFRQRVRGD